MRKWRCFGVNLARFWRSILRKRVLYFNLSDVWPRGPRHFLFCGKLPRGKEALPNVP